MRGVAALGLAADQGDCIRAQAEDLRQFAELQHFGDGPAGLPLIDGLRADADLERQIKLGLALFLAQLADRRHPGLLSG
jgi:hypothetical protein